MDLCLVVEILLVARSFAPNDCAEFGQFCLEFLELSLFLIVFSFCAFSSLLQPLEFIVELMLFEHFLLRLLVELPDYVDLLISLFFQKLVDVVVEDEVVQLGVALIADRVQGGVHLGQPPLVLAALDTDHFAAPAAEQ